MVPIRGELEGASSRRCARGRRIERDRKPPLHAIASLLVLLAALIVTPCAGQWVHNGVVVIDSSNGDVSHEPVMAADGHGGVYIAYTDRSAPDGVEDVFVQRLDGNGRKVWPSNGIPVCVAPGTQAFPAIAANGNTGVFVAWIEAGVNGAHSLFAQYLTADGTPRWKSGGFPISDLASRLPPMVTSDGGDGMFIVWFAPADGARKPGQWFAQHIDSKGGLGWGINGVALQIEPFAIERLGGTFAPVCTVLPDGSGGLYAAWILHSDEAHSYSFPYAQHISKTGKRQWGDNAILLNDSAFVGLAGLHILEKHGDASVSFGWTSDAPPVSGPTCRKSWSIFLQRLNRDGQKLLGLEGRQLEGGLNDFDAAGAVPDGKGGMIVAMNCDNMPAVFRVDSLGKAVWSAIVPAYPQPGTGYTMITNPSAVSDGEGGVMLFWHSLRMGNPWQEINFQRVDSSGRLIAGDVPVIVSDTCWAVSRSLQRVEVSPGVVILAWNGRYQDGRNYVRVSKISRDGITGIVDVAPEGAPSRPTTYPNPAHGGMTIEFSADVPGPYTCTVTDARGGRLRQERREFGAGTAGLWRLDTSGFAPGTYLYRIEGGRLISVGRFVIAAR